MSKQQSHNNPRPKDPGLIRPTGPDLSDDDSRVSRSMADQEREGEDGTILSMEERKTLLRKEWDADLLPTVKDPTGKWHYCWLSTTNATDPIYRRLKIGYELVRFEEMSQLGIQNQITSGEFAGCVSINEMILARIHHELYEELMLINHHERPMSEEELLKANVNNRLSEEEDQSGKPLGRVIGRGMQTLAQPTRIPTFKE